MPPLVSQRSEGLLTGNCDLSFPLSPPKLAHIFPLPPCGHWPPCVSYVVCKSVCEREDTRGPFNTDIPLFDGGHVSQAFYYITHISSPCPNSFLICDLIWSPTPN